MSVDYVEEYEIGNGHSFGIENIAGKRDRQRTDKRQFQLWHNGCGCGGAMNLPEAREAIRQYAVDVLKQDRDRAVNLLVISAQPLQRIDCDPRAMDEFRVRRRRRR